MRLLVDVLLALPREHREARDARFEAPASRRQHEFIFELANQLPRIGWNSEMLDRLLIRVRPINDGIRQSSRALARLHRNANVCAYVARDSSGSLGAIGHGYGVASG